MTPVQHMLCGLQETWWSGKCAEPTVVTLAEGSTSRFRLKKGTKILLSEPGQPEAWIVPMGGLTELDFNMHWTGNPVAPFKMMKADKLKYKFNMDVL